MASHIFISHSSKDQKVARTICTALENRGLTCWVYSRNIRPGQNFQEQIVRAIRAAKIMVLVFTANANSSNEIKKELAIASQNNLVVIPVRIEDVIPNEAFAYEFATRQWIDLFDDWESSIARLTELIATTSDDHPLGEQTKAGSGSSDDVAGPPAGKVVKAGSALTIGPMSFMQQPGPRWTMIFGLAVIVVAGITYGVLTLRKQAASLSGAVTNGSPTQSVPAAATRTGASDPLRLDLITDCDRLAAFPGDPQSPQGVTGILTDQIDIVPALTACNAAMRQYPDVARFTFQAGRIAVAQKDYMQARQLFEKAAAAGSKGALNGLGTLYQGGLGVAPDYTEALNWYQKAAAAGETTAFGNIGNFYTNGWGTPKDYVEARKWYERGAAAGQANALYSLGLLYENGFGVPQDYAKARSLYEQAAASGFPNAMSEIGNLYDKGLGVPQDFAEARKWMEKAAAAGSTNGMNGLGYLYQRGAGVPQDYAKARNWYEKAAAAGNPRAPANLGYLYTNGYGVPQDFSAARTWYEKGAAAGNAFAMNGLGNIYYNGNGVAQDYAAARTWYEKAAAAGNAIAMSNLGNIYYNGNGVSKDYDQARIWYAKAVAAGYTSASAIIKQIDASKQK